MSETFSAPINPQALERVALWDSGTRVPCLDMGGIGPGYDWAINALAFELVRAYAQAHESLDWVDGKFTGQKFLDEVVMSLSGKPWDGFTGAQVGSAQWLAVKEMQFGWNRLVELAAENNESDRIRELVNLFPGYDIEAAK